MALRKLCVLVALLLLPGLAVGGSEKQAVRKPITVVKDRAEFIKELAAKGHKAKGGIAKSKTEDDDARHKSFPHFTSSFTYQGVRYPYTMVGYAPTSGKTTKVRPVIIPLRMNFVYFEQDVSFDPAKAVDNIVRSPMFNDAQFPNGVGQFGDMLQRATFWNKMDDKRKWHVLMQRPRVLDTVDVLVEPDVGELFETDPGTFIGNLRFGAMDSTIHTLLQFIDIQPDELPIFVTYNVTSDALGYHDAFDVGQNDGTDVLQTLIYTSWLEPAIVGDLLADVSTLNHELGEWLNDPYVNNVVPTWAYPPFNQVCADNPYLEVGDPQGNGPDYNLFPTIVVPLNGYAYHLQDLVMLPWFAGEKHSSAQNGWYDFPGTTQVTIPFVPCS